MRTLLSLGLSLFLSLSLLSASQAATYRWVDETGQVHYSQKPPKSKNIEYERIDINVPPSYKSTPIPNPTTDSSTSSTDISSSPDTDKIIKNEIKDSAALRKENCEKAKESLKLYSVYRRVRDADGNIKVLTDEEREKLIKDAEQAVREFCGN